MAKRKRLGHGNSTRYSPVRELSKAEFSVNDFLALNFPGISSEIISNNVACWFSNARQFRSVTSKHPSPLKGWWKWRLVIVTTTWYFNKLPIYHSYVRYPLILGQIQQIRTILGQKMGQIWRSGQFWGNFWEARYNPDKSAGPLSGQKLPFQDQASPTITRGPR